MINVQKSAEMDTILVVLDGVWQLLVQSVMMETIMEEMVAVLDVQLRTTLILRVTNPDGFVLQEIMPHQIIAMNGVEMDEELMIQINLCQEEICLNLWNGLVMMETQNQEMDVMIIVEQRRDFFVQAEQLLLLMFAMKSVVIGGILDSSNAMMETQMLLMDAMETA